MTEKVLTLMSAVVVLLIIGGWLGVSFGERAILRSPHSDPRIATRPEIVAVTSQGKLYHDPDCAFIHGPIRVEIVIQLALTGDGYEGYTPCTRCLKR